MLLLLLAYIMRFVDISKVQQQQRQRQQRCCTTCGSAGVECHMDANGNTTCCWQHVATTGNSHSSNSNNSNTSSTSSGCDSSSSSKENYYAPQREQQQFNNNSNSNNNGLTPQQLQQLRYYQHMQQQQLQLLQQQLMQRRRLQQQLREQGVVLPKAKPATTTAAGFTCNQQYLMQQRMQQQQQQHMANAHHNNINNNKNNFVGLNVLAQGLKLRRGMTDFSTVNDNNNISNINSHIEHYFPQPSSFNHEPSSQYNNPHSPSQKQSQSHLHYNTRLTAHRQSLPAVGLKQYNNNGNTAAHNTRTLASVSGPGSAPQSPQQHYRIPLNSPNNSLFQLGKRYQQQQLNDRLLQQQHLQYCQQQQLLLQSLGNEELESPNADAAADAELSEESLKQNVAIVLSNLDRYNSALRSIILNEQVNNSLFLCDDNLDEADNNNFLLQSTTATAMAATNMAAVATPESDYNSNATTPGAARNNEQHGWFLDYGYRDGCGGMQRSVLSSLSASYNAMGDLIYYDDLAKNLDANLAEVDMESFRAEDIHSLLSQLPAYCKSLGGANSRLQQSLLYQQQQQQQQQQQLQMHMQHSNNMMMMSNLQHMATTHNNMSQTSTTSTNELIDNSFCKSELLFSPVKESHISVDSLDMDAYPDEGDMILTCNKDNYTIAFEGSVLYSDDSFYEPCEIAVRNKQNCINLHSNLEDIVKRNKALEVSMSRSAQSMHFLCKSPIKHQTKAQLQRYPSGNNNNGNTETIILTRHLPQCSVRKSSSLPNLQSELCASSESCSRQEQHQDEQQEGPLNVSQAISTSTMESCSSRSRNLLPMCQMPISISEEQQQQQQCQTDEQHKESSSATTPTPTPQQQQQSHHQHHHHHHRHKHRCGCGLSSTQGSQNFCSAAAAAISGSASSGNSNPAAFNLVKLFIKQKSSSSGGSGSSSCAHDENQAGALTCMDVSSGCWPSSSCSSSSLEKRLRKKSMNDSGKGSAVSRHDEDEQENDEAEPADVDVELTPKRQLRSRCDAVFYDDGASSSSTGSLTATNSPAHRRRSMPLRNPQLYQLAAAQTQTQSQQSSDASNSEQVTQVQATQRRNAATRPVSCASSSEMITRSMQTSCGSLSTTHSSSLSERYRCVPPSFLAKLHNLGEQREAPIYVIYPNYALPDLGFVKTSSNSSDVIFTPFNYKMTLESAGVSSKQQQQQARSSSQSVNEHELFKTLDYKHISDWQSLATLLPVEYRRRLQHIPEVKQITGQLEAELSQKPLFCMTPPIRRNRSHICDCAKSIQQQQQQQQQTQLDEASSSGSSQPPSSGYRGSSTLLTDSEVDPADPLKQMYVYQYDQQQQQQRMDSGVETSPAASSRPQPMPRSILRKAKRNSMIEATNKQSKLEKRRSLQEPPYNYALGSTDELAEVFEEEENAVTTTTTPPTKQRLSRKDLDARARAENFLASLPRSELKYYAEIAAILESSGEHVLYDAAALKKEVSRVLSQQKKVSFNDATAAAAAADLERAKRFSTPPNSPNISVAALQRRETLDVQEQRKIESNRFKRLQIQWELMSKDSSMLKELANEQATKSGGSTPTSTNSAGGTSGSAPKSRIPRPVSYPAGRSPKPSPSTSTKTPKTPTPKTVTKSKPSPANLSSPQICRVSSSGQDAANSGKCGTRSPSRIVPPKRYSLAGTPTSSGTPTASRARTPTNRTGSAGTTPGTPGTTPNTPKRHSANPTSRPTSRVR